MAENFQMLGNAALMERPKVAFLSSRKVAPAVVMRIEHDYEFAKRQGPDLSPARPCTALPKLSGRLTTHRGVRMAVYQSRIGIARGKIKILVHHGTEPDFIINYDIKYRMGDELNAGE